MEVKMKISLNEQEIVDILKKHIEDKGYKIKDFKLVVRGKEGDIQIPKGASGDCVGFHSEVIK